MSGAFRSITSYADHLGKAKGRYRIHSPFVYELLENCIRDRSPRRAYAPIERIVEQLQKDKSRIEVRDYGAGSKWAGKRERKVGEIARKSGSERKFGRLLFRLAERFAPEHALELGSSLGIGSMYLAKGSSGTLHSIEGCPSSLRIARKTLEELGVGNVEFHEGSFGEKLPSVLEKLPSLDLVRIDGDHRGEAMLAYFERCLEKAHNDTLFVLDDIHWSRDMEAAWEELQRDERVRLTLDLFHAGLLFIRKEQKEPLHLRIRF